MRSPQSPRTIWRLDGLNEATTIEHERLLAGLRLHVAHSPLTCVAIRIGARQQYYVVLDGCSGCLTEHCRIGCRAALFRRLLPACIAGVELCPLAVPQGFARRPYQQAALAWPGAAGQPLQASLLQPWQEARLILDWRFVRSSVQCSALVFASAEAPNPRAQLCEAGWTPLPLPTRLLLRWGQRPLPAALPFGAPWSQGIRLLTPACAQAECKGSEQ